MHTYGLSGLGIINSSTHTMSFPDGPSNFVVMSASSGIEVQQPGAVVSIACGLARDMGSAPIIKKGAGTLILSGAAFDADVNFYEVQQGTLTINTTNPK